MSEVSAVGRSDVSDAAEFLEQILWVKMDLNQTRNRWLGAEEETRCLQAAWRSETDPEKLTEAEG